MKTYVVCDLDDCLIKTDLLYEHWLLLLKCKPLLWLISPLWLLKGIANFKNKIAHHVVIQTHSLPYREEVLNYLKESKNNNKNSEFILASASPLPWVSAVSQHLGIFDHILGSSETKNLKGSAKLESILQLTKEDPFTYIADAPVDLEIWKDASSIVSVNASKSLRAKIDALSKPTKHIKDKKRSICYLLLKQLRPHQWIKNALVFLPAFAGHKLFSSETILLCLYAFGGFSLSASFVYVLNDLLDLKSDRNHHSKKNRPFASANLPIKWGLLLLPSLLIGAFVFASLLPAEYSLWISFYLVLNLAYSLYLKQSVVVDVIILSMMYTLRIFAGSAATEVPVSDWLLNFSTLFFFSLACVKRYTEIVRSKNKITIDGRGYRQVDHSMMQALGVGTGLLSVLIILLYLRSNEVRTLYSNPQFLWFATPVLLFWISRIWILTNRDEIHDDPVVFAVKDKASWICLVILAVVFGISS